MDGALYNSTFFVWFLPIESLSSVQSPGAGCYQYHRVVVHGVMPRLKPHRAELGTLRAAMSSSRNSKLATERKLELDLIVSIDGDDVNVHCFHS